MLHKLEVCQNRQNFHNTDAPAAVKDFGARQYRVCIMQCEKLKTD